VVEILSLMLLLLPLLVLLPLLDHEITHSPFEESPREGFTWGRKKIISKVHTHKSWSN